MKRKSLFFYSLFHITTTGAAVISLFYFAYTLLLWQAFNTLLPMSEKHRNYISVIHTLPLNSAHFLEQNSVLYFLKREKKKKESSYPFIKCEYTKTLCTSGSDSGNGDNRVDDPRVFSLFLFIELFFCLQKPQAIA